MRTTLNSTTQSVIARAALGRAAISERASADTSWTVVAEPAIFGPRWRDWQQSSVCAVGPENFVAD